MFLHADFHFLLLEFYVHAQKIVLVSSFLRYLPKLLFNCLDNLIDHIWIHLADLVIIHLPAHRALLSFDVCVCYTQILWVHFKTHVL